MAKCRFRRNWYRFRMRPDASGCVRDASGMRRDASGCVGMRRDFVFRQISANSSKIPAKFGQNLAKFVKFSSILTGHGTPAVHLFLSEGPKRREIPTVRKPRFRTISPRQEGPNSWISDQLPNVSVRTAHISSRNFFKMYQAITPKP